MKDLALSGCFWGSTYSLSQAYVNSTNIFINFVKRSLVRGTRGRIGASKWVKALERIGALLLPAFDLLTGPWEPASLSCSSMGSVGGLLQRLCQIQDSEAITMKIWL